MFSSGANFKSSSVYFQYVNERAAHGVHGRKVERRPCNHEVQSSSPGSGSQLWDFSLAHTFGASTGVVPWKQNRERLV